MSIAGGIPRALERALRASCNVLQIFVKNNNQWKGKPILEEEIIEFRNGWARSGIRSIVAHDCYLINLAAPGKDLWQLSIRAFIDEMERCEQLGLEYLVTHPGSHMGEGEQRGVERIAEAINEVHRQTSGHSVRIALETTAGQGTNLGYRFEHLRDILSHCRHPERVFVCVDTCHLFAAGYDFRDEESYQATVEKFDRVIGLGRLRLFHFNDSKKGFGSRVDRHEHIGKGQIGPAGFAFFLNDPRFAGIPKIIETPKGKTLRLDCRNLRYLRSLAA